MPVNNLLGGASSQGQYEPGAGSETAFQTIYHSIIAQWPDILGRDRAAFYWIGNHLSEAERQQLVPGAPPGNRIQYDIGRMSEFERRDLAARFRSTLLPRVVGAARRLPYEIFDIRSFYVQEYDFAAGRFPLGEKGFNKAPTLELKGSGELGITLNSSLPLKTWPTFLPIPPDRAQRLLARLKNREVFLATHVSLRGMTRDNSRDWHAITLDLQPVRMAFYADPQLRDQIATVDIDPLRTAPPAPTDSEVLALQRTRPISADALVALVAEMTGTPSFIDRVVRDSHLFRSASEFNRQEVFAREKTRFAMAAPDSFWLPGWVTLGEYDIEKQAFGVEAILLAPGDTSSSSSGRHIKAELPSSERLPAVPVSRERAEAGLKLARSGERRFDIRLRVKAVRADIQPDDQRSPRARLIVQPEEIFVFSPSGPQGPIVLARAQFNLRPEAPAPRQPARVPDRLVLDFEAFDLLAIREEPARIDAMLERMFHERWALEQQPGDPAWGRFFTAGRPLPNVIARPTALAAFREWTMSRVAQLPRSALLISRQARASSHGSCEPLDVTSMVTDPARDFPQPLGKATHGAQDVARAEFRQVIFSASRPHAIGPAYFLVKGRPLHGASCAAPGGAQLPASAGLGNRPPASTVIVLGNALLPDGKMLPQLGFSEFEVEIDRVVPRGEAASPDLQIFASVTRARHLTSVGPQRVVALELTPKDILPEASPAAGTDVSGVRLGMSFEEAERTIKAHMPVGRILETERRPPPPDQPLRPFQAARLYIRDDSMEFFILFHEPPDEKHTVIGVTRWYIVPDGQVFSAQFNKALRDKYGPPSDPQGISDEMNMPRVWMSPSAAARRHGSRGCAFRVAGDLRDEVEWSENGASADWRSPNVPGGPAFLPANPAARTPLPWPGWNDQLPASCGTMIASRFETTGPRRTGRGTAEMTVMMVDAGRAVRALENARAALAASPQPGPRLPSPAEQAVADKLKL